MAKGKCLRDLSDMNVHLPTNMVQILGHNNIDIYRVLIKYIRATKNLIYLLFICFLCGYFFFSGGLLHVRLFK